MDLTQFDHIIINTSAGKDSLAMMDYLYEMASNQGVAHRLVAVHADLGRAEWQGTKELAEEHAQSYGMRFEVTKARDKDGQDKDLLSTIEARGMWPSSTTRYCTSDFKRGPVGRIITKLDRELRALRGKDETYRFLNCMGLRAEESPARAKKQPMSENQRTSTQRRKVTEWLPILDWTSSQVWERIRQSGRRHHPAYDLGMPRLSCVFCVFAPRHALILAGRNNPDLLTEYVRAENNMGHTFRQNLSIKDIQVAIEDGEEVGPMDDKWNM